jgi:hypothetical protein
MSKTKTNKRQNKRSSRKNKRSSRKNKRSSRKNKPQYGGANPEETKFILLCGRNYVNLKTAQDFLLQNSSINISAVNDDAFNNACKYGHLDVAQWLFSLGVKPGSSKSNTALFKLVIDDERLDVAQWLLSVKPDINIASVADFAFRSACTNGNLVFAKWLLSVYPDMDVSSIKLHPIQRDSTFISTCSNGHFEVAKWLVSLNRGINIGANDHEAFRKTCETASYSLPSKKITEWLQSLNPYVYKIEYNEDGSVKNCSVNTELEARINNRYTALHVASDMASPNLLQRLPEDVARYTIQTYL